jgi:hypothetical protein
MQREAPAAAAVDSAGEVRVWLNESAEKMNLCTCVRISAPMKSAGAAGEWERASFFLVGSKSKIMCAFVFRRNLIGCSRVGYELCVAVLRVEIDFL